MRGQFNEYDRDHRPRRQVHPQAPHSQVTPAPAPFSAFCAIFRPPGRRPFASRSAGPRTSKLTHYYVRVLPSDFGFATSWEKWAQDGGDGTSYQCNVGGEAIIAMDDDGEPISEGGPGVLLLPRV